MSPARFAAAATLTLCVLVFSASPVTGQELRWDASSSRTTVGYIVSIGTRSGIYSQEINVGNTTAYPLAGFSRNTTYFFAVQAHDAGGFRSAYTPEVILAASGAAADFGSNGTLVRDGRADLLWQHADGWLAVWHMEQSRLTAGVYLNPARVTDTNWRIAGTGDMNADGNADVVWQHRTSGMVAVWLMNGAQHMRSVFIDSVSDVRWLLAAVADMNADGRPDFIWQHPSGLLVVWYMSGTRILRGETLSPTFAPASARLAAAADFDGDGRTDLLWHTSSGQLSVWVMNGRTRVSTRSLNPASINNIWRIVAVSDYNQDGRPDLIFQHNDGYLAVWYLNGLAMTSSSALNPSIVGGGGVWQIVGPR
jgi:hypothetical protein